MRVLDRPGDGLIPSRRGRPGVGYLVVPADGAGLRFSDVLVGEAGCGSSQVRGMAAMVANTAIASPPCRAKWPGDGGRRRPPCVSLAGTSSTRRRSASGFTSRERRRHRSRREWSSRATRLAAIMVRSDQAALGTHVRSPGLRRESVARRTPVLDPGVHGIRSAAGLVLIGGPGQHPPATPSASMRPAPHRGLMPQHT